MSAISYIGSAAAELLDLVGDDMIIIDGSDAALQAGQVDPRTISRRHKAGVDVRTLPNLHAKMIHLEGSETYVVIGSANAFARSRDLLKEAAVLTDDEGLCTQVAEQLDVWWAESDPIDQTWLKRAREIHRPPAHVPAQRRAAPQPRRLWIGIGINDPVPVPPKAAAARENLEQGYGRGVVDSWPMNPGGERAVRPGDEIVLVQAGPLRQQPRRNFAHQPASNRGSCRPRQKEADRLAGLAEQLPDAVDRVGGEIDWDKSLPARSPTAEAIGTRWGQRAARSARH